MKEIEGNDFDLNISRYVSIAKDEEEIDLKATHERLMKIEQEIRKAAKTRNEFLDQLGLPRLP